jgi:UDP-GlcNAc:undecaprenyl-phosphate GlcNAc-1-phosphate transferase
MPRSDRWRREPVALLGGVAIYLSVAATGSVAMAIGNAGVGLLAAGSLIFLLGLRDDLRPLGPPAKLAAEAMVALALVALGVRLEATGSTPVDSIVTVLWVVGMINAVNLLDNMDGLAAGVVVIAAGFRMSLFLLQGDTAGAGAAAIVAGAAAGFLLHNRHPASVFMGDSGSLFLGFCLAGLELGAGGGRTHRSISLGVAAGLIVLLPIFETVWIVATRWHERRPLTRGGRDHVSHRLVAFGLSEPLAVAALHGAAIVSGALALVTYRFGAARTAPLIALWLVALAVVGVWLARLPPPPDEPAPPGSARDRISEGA